MYSLRNGWQRLDSPRTTLLVVLGLYLVFFWVRLGQFGGDISRFVVAGDHITTRADAPPNLAVLPDSDGYDGQFYYRLAIEPLASTNTNYGVSFDGNPAYRQQRILYPLLAHLASLGRPLLVPLALVVVNLIAAGLLGWLAGRLAQHWGHHAVVGLGLALYPGFLLVFDRNLSELTAAMFLSFAVLALLQQRHGWATVGLCLALLTKETFLGVAIAAVPAFAWARLRRRDAECDTASPRWFVWAAPGALFVAWQVLLWRHWGRFAFARRTVSFVLGKTGPASHTQLPAFFRVLSRYLPQHNLTALELALLGIFMLLVLVALWRSRATLHLKLAFLAYVALAMVINHYWGGDWAFMRALAELWVLGGVILLAWRRDVAALFALSATVCWCLLALNVVIYR